MGHERVDGRDGGLMRRFRIGLGGFGFALHVLHVGDERLESRQSAIETRRIEGQRILDAKRGFAFEHEIAGPQGSRGFHQRGKRTDQRGGFKQADAARGRRHIADVERGVGPERAGIGGDYALRD